MFANAWCTHIHTCTHAHMHTCTHAHMHTCTHASHSHVPYRFSAVEEVATMAYCAARRRAMTPCSSADAHGTTSTNSAPPSLVRCTAGELHMRGNSGLASSSYEANTRRTPKNAHVLSTYVGVCAHRG